MVPLDGSKSIQPAPGTKACTHACVLPPVMLSSSGSARLRYPDTNRAAMPKADYAAWPKVAEVAATIRRDLEARGEPIGMADCMIAAVCMTHDGVLLTRNRKHFERVTDLKVSGN